MAVLAKKEGFVGQSPLTLRASSVSVPSMWAAQSRLSVLLTVPTVHVVGAPCLQKGWVEQVQLGSSTSGCTSPCPLGPQLWGPHPGRTGADACCRRPDKLCVAAAGQAPLPGTCSQSVPTGISSVIPARTCTFHLLSRAHSVWSSGLQWTLTKVAPAGWKQGRRWVSVSQPPHLGRCEGGGFSLPPV